MWASHAESECGKHVREDRQLKNSRLGGGGWRVERGGGDRGGAQARSEWPVRQRVPLVLDRAVQTGGVHVVVVVEVVLGSE